MTYLIVLNGHPYESERDYIILGDEGKPVNIAESGQRGGEPLDRAGLRHTAIVNESGVSFHNRGHRRRTGGRLCHVR